MALAIQITGTPGSGKTFSLKSLVAKFPNEVYYINADRKPMPWAGWRSVFSEARKNYVETSDIPTIFNYLKGISEKRPDIKICVVDTINTMMSDKEMKERKIKGFDKWQEMAGGIYDGYGIIPDLRDDLCVIFMAHTESFEEDGETHYRTKLNGQKLTKLNLNSKISYNLYTKVEYTGDTPEYFFITQSNGRTEARSTYGVLDYKMPNDLGEVISRIRKYDFGITEQTNDSTEKKS